MHVDDPKKTDYIWYTLEVFFYLRFDYLFGPINFTVVNVKTRPTITGVASYGLSSCSLLQLLSYLNHVHIDSIILQISQVYSTDFNDSLFTH